MDIIKRINKTPTAIWIVLPKLSPEQLEQVIALSADSYYNTGVSLITDEIYDILVEKLRFLKPKSTVLKKIGAEIKGKKTDLPYWMGSMNKIKADENALENWMNANQGPYLISDKLDGVSCLLIVDAQNVANLYTRGNGKVGQDITHLIGMVNIHIPKLDMALAVRGELIMSMEHFEKYSEEMSNARNMVSGIVNSKKDSVNKKHARDVDFIAYEIIEPTGLTPLEQIKKLAKLEMLVVSYNLYKEISIDYLQKILKKNKAKSGYEIDGIIITQNLVHKRNISGNPSYSVAFKGMTQTTETKVIEVLWKPAKDGHIIPRIHFEKVRLSQVDIEYTAGFNAKYIYDNLIGPGAIITIIRSGDTIPYIMGVVKPAKKPDMPDDLEYEWDDTQVNIILTNADKNKTVIIRRITKFVRDIGVENMSEGIVTRLVTAGYDTIPSIINLTKDDLMELDGFQDSLSEKLINNLDTSLKKLNILTLMVASNCFGRGFGERKIKKILNVYPDIVQKYTQSPSSTEKWIDKLVAIDGFDTISATKFMTSLAEFQKFYKTISAIRPIAPYKNADLVSELFKGQTIVFTGFRTFTGMSKNDSVSFIESNGGKVSGSVSGNTTLLIYADGEETSGKYLTAVSKGVKTISKTEFEKKYRL